MSQELVVAAGLAGGPDAAFGNQGMDESLSDGIGGGYPLIRYKGKVWSIQVRGENYHFTGADGYGQPFLDVIILRQAQNKSKAYFENYEEGSKDAPVCTSSDGLVPDLGVLHKQADTCAMCPRNVFKMNDKGVKVKECGDAKRLAVLPLPAQTKKILGEPLVEPVFLRVPAASLQGLAQMGDAAKKMGFPYFAFVTRIDFDPDKSYPKMRFSAIQKITGKVAEKILELREDPMSYRICGGDTTGQNAMKQVQQMAPADQNLLAGAPAAPPGHPTPEQLALAAKLEADRLARLAAVKADAAAKEAANAAAAQAAVPPPKANPPPEPIMLELTANPPAPAPAVSPTGLEGIAAQPVSDTGEPDQADAALDAAIADLLPPSS